MLNFFSSCQRFFILFTLNEKIMHLSYWVFALFLALKFGHAFASGTDIGAGTTEDAIATESGSGKIWLYVIEGAVAGYGFIKTRNVAVLGGVFVLSLFINIVLKKFIGS